MEQHIQTGQHGFSAEASSAGMSLNLDSLDIQELESRLELAPVAGDEAVTVSVGWEF